jgi:hypothetical protein
VFDSSARLAAVIFNLSIHLSASTWAATRQIMAAGVLGRTLGKT